MVSGGGTAGHVYPALSVIEALTNLGAPAVTLCWVGSAEGVEKALVRQAGIPFESIAVSKIRGRNPLAALHGLWTMQRGFWQARRLVAGFRPDVLFVTGGYVCWPVTLAAWRAGVPLLIYLPDLEPGLAIKSLARFARRVAVTDQAAQRFFGAGQTVVTGYPVRAGLFSRDRAEARRALGLPADKESVLLVFGGSQGAHSINQAVVQGIAQLLSAAHVVHVTGRRDAPWVQTHRAQLPATWQARYHVYDYLDAEMVDALVAADLAIARAGASTLGELPAAGLPAVLVPYPYAGAHQWANARWLVHAGAALAVPDQDLASALVPTVLELLNDEPRRTAMSRAARALARPDAARSIAELLCQLATRG